MCHDDRVSTWFWQYGHDVITVNPSCRRVPYSTHALRGTVILTVGNMVKNSPARKGYSGCCWSGRG